MATLTVEGVPAPVLARLAAAAAANGRCLNSELIVLLARALPPRPGDEQPPRCRRAAASSGFRCACRAAVGWGGPAS